MLMEGPRERALSASGFRCGEQAGSWPFYKGRFSNMANLYVFVLAHSILWRAIFWLFPCLLNISLIVSILRAHYASGFLAFQLYCVN